MTGMPKDAAGGVENYMCVPKSELHARIEKGLAGLGEEVNAHGTEEDRECLRVTGWQKPSGVPTSAVPFCRIASLEARAQGCPTPCMPPRATCLRQPPSCATQALRATRGGGRNGQGLPEWHP